MPIIYEDGTRRHPYLDEWTSRNADGKDDLERRTTAATRYTVTCEQHKRELGKRLPQKTFREASTIAEDHLNLKGNTSHYLTIQRHIGA